MSPAQAAAGSASGTAGGLGTASSIGQGTGGANRGSAGSSVAMPGVAGTRAGSTAGTGAFASGAAGSAAAGTTPGASGTGAILMGAAGTMPSVTGGGAGTNVMPGNNGACGSLPAVTDYSAPGPYPTTTMDGTGPDGMYTIYRPTTLGDNGFKHPLITWGNGITTTPQLYPGLLGGIASHGFVIVASDSSNVTAQMMTQGLDWLIKQNDPGGMFAGQLNTGCLATVGYSLGGGGAVDSGSHPNVLATVSFHGLPGAAANLQGPLLLFTSTADGFVTKDNFVKPCYDASSKVPTIMATMAVDGYPAGPNNGTSANADFAGHIYPVGDAGIERAPAIAWLRLWIYGDQGAKSYFYGANCILCMAPWIDIQRKNAMW